MSEMFGVTRSFGGLNGRAFNSSGLEVYCSSKHRYMGLSIANSYNNFIRFTSSKTSPFVHASRGNPNALPYEVEEGKGGSGYDPLIRMANCKKKDEGLANIKKGDIVNLSDLLFTEYRDYLVKCNEDQQVNSEQLAGKVVVLYFGSVWAIMNDHIKSLMHVYSDLQPSNGFEVVIVNIDKYTPVRSFGRFHQVGQEYLVENILSSMPWTAIPLSDITCRKQLKQRFGIPEVVYNDYSFIIDSTGKVLQCGDLSIFHRYGALGYPFSDERIDYIKSEDDRAGRQPSLEALLASPQRDYLISNKGDKVPIHTLEDKVVALYFYEEGVTNKNITRELKTVYEELAKDNKKFEVVLIYFYDTISTQNSTNEDTFRKTFKDMPWLALPFKDTNYKKLERILFYPWFSDGLGGQEESALIIIGPHVEFIELFGAFILRNFKTRAFPFSLKKVAELLTEETQELKLEMLWEPDSVFGEKCGFPVKYSQLAGKRVIIIFESCWLFEHEALFLESLKKRYKDLKGTADEFEVIHFVKESYDFEPKEYQVTNLPWFVHPAGEKRGPDSNLFNFYENHNCYNGGCSLVAFDRDGRVVRRTIYPSVEDLYFPFYAGGLEKEALSQLVEVFSWDGWDRSHNNLPGKLYLHRRSYVLG